MMPATAAEMLATACIGRAGWTTAGSETTGTIRDASVRNIRDANNDRGTRNYIYSHNSWKIIHSQYASNRKTLIAIALMPPIARYQHQQVLRQ
jgi:hypothetical protein